MAAPNHELAGPNEATPPQLDLFAPLRSTGSLENPYPIYSLLRKVRPVLQIPLADFDGKALAPPEGKPERWINAAIPVGLVLVVTFVALWFTGRASLVAEGDCFTRRHRGQHRRARNP